MKHSWQQVSTKDNKNEIAMSSARNDRGQGKFNINFFVCFCLLLLLLACASEDKKLFEQAIEFQNQQKYEAAIKIYNTIMEQYSDGQYAVNAAVKLEQCKQKIVTNNDNLNPKSPNSGSIIEKKYIEKSLEKRDIEIRILGTGKNKLAIIGSMHGDEPQGKYIIKRLIEDIKVNSKLIENRQILFIPVANPDGLLKNTRGNANGVDLNRNFPAKNWQKKSRTEEPRYYPGDKPESEPETRILIKYISDFHPKLIINIHSPYKVINYDANCLKAAELMAKYNKYKITADIGYPTPGSFGTYFGTERNMPVITLETGPEIGETAWMENKEALITVIQNLEFI